MGEARRKREQEAEEYERTRQQYLRELEKLTVSPTEEEIRIAAEVHRLPLLVIRRLAMEQIAWMRMQPQQCHQNAWSYVKLDPTGRSRHVFGWRHFGCLLSFHSVVEISGQMVCITPHLESMFAYIPDPKIQTVWDDTVGGIPMRDGQPVPQRIRTNPKQVIEDAQAVRDQVLADVCLTKLQWPASIAGWLSYLGPSAEEVRQPRKAVQAQGGHKRTAPSRYKMPLRAPQSRRAVPIPLHANRAARKAAEAAQAGRVSMW